VADGDWVRKEPYDVVVAEALDQAEDRTGAMPSFREDLF
jgi:hypothetical protein